MTSHDKPICWKYLERAELSGTYSSKFSPGQAAPLQWRSGKDISMSFNPSNILKLDQALL
jgi:hypothetical protein